MPACRWKSAGDRYFEKLIRLSVGIEATEDLIEDFGQALG
jgi:cystathionine beta-lyase/cystathionine gamma-synthase